ncbi:hypothetical protein NLA10_11940, partial [Akkermansia muciniphila]
PLEKLLGRGAEEALVGQLAVQPIEKALIGLNDGLAIMDGSAMGLRLELNRTGVKIYSQSNAPFFHA